MIAGINLASVPQLSLEKALPRVRAHGFKAVGLWYEPVWVLSVAQVKQQLADEGLRVSSLCPAGSFGDQGPEGFEAAVKHTLATIEMAAELNADCLCLLPGSYARRQTDFEAARAAGRRGLEAVLPRAQELGVTVAIEPLHPMYTDGFSVVNTIAEALEWCTQYGVSLFVDTYHVWWDRELARVLAQAAGRVAGFHINDWRRETSDLVQDRAVPGEGVIDLPRIVEAVQKTGYDGVLELEIFSLRHAKDDPEAWLRRCRESLRAFQV
ncbi:MAG: sugar phosphate isomerase/epimerase family protein [Opitutales bacterium]